MSAHEQGDEVPSAGAAAAPAPTAGERQQSKQHALEEKMRKLEADIEQLKTKIALGEAKADNTKNEALELELRRAITEAFTRMNLLEVERAELRQDIKKLSAPVEQPTAAGETLSYLVLTLALTHRLASQGITRAPLATRT
jgi:predicted  nucleic acid-binding Zn-ribbon protein